MISDASRAARSQTLGGGELLDRVPPLLDLLAEHLDDFDVGQGVPDIDLAVLQRSKDRPQQ